MQSIQPIIQTIATVVIAMCAVNSNLHHQPDDITIVNTTTLNIQDNTRILYTDMYTENQ